MEHIIWSCPSTRDVWGCGPKKLQKGTSKGLTFLHVVQELMARCELANLELFAITSRFIWFRRNDVVHGREFSHPSILFQNATTSLENFCHVQASETGGQPILPAAPPAAWQKPPPGIIKLNWDAAVDQRLGRIGIGIIARDCDGVVLELAIQRIILLLNLW